MKPTREEWKEIEKELEHIYGRVELSIDGFKVELTLATIAKFRLAIIVYINGWLKAEYWRNDCEERRRFYCHGVRYVYKKKFRYAMSKLAKRRSFRAKILKELGLKDDLDINKTIDTYAPYWTSFSKLKAHLLKHNESIEWTNKPKPIEEEMPAGWTTGKVTNG